ncbi:hypothetical protein DFH09DRAFT_947070, partial [Mycena vulgaris]
STVAPNKNKLPKLPGIAWSANDAALTWTLLEKLRKPVNSIVLFGKQDRK